MNQIELQKEAELFASKLYYPTGNSESELNWVNNHRELIKVGFEAGAKSNYVQIDKLEFVIDILKGIEGDDDKHTEKRRVLRINELNEKIQSLNKQPEREVEIVMECVHENPDKCECGIKVRPKLHKKIVDGKEYDCLEIKQIKVK